MIPLKHLLAGPDHWLARYMAVYGHPMPGRLLQWLSAPDALAGSWFLLDDVGAIATAGSLGRQHPRRPLLPVARRADRDDIACFELAMNDAPSGRVMVIHDDAMTGVEVEAVFPSVDGWLDHIEGGSGEYPPLGAGADMATASGQF